MNSEVIINLLGGIILAINCLTIFLIFDTKRGLLFSIGSLFAFSIILMIFVQYVRVMGVAYSGIRGLVYLPIILVLFKGEFFQKIFAFFLQFTLTIFQSTLATSIISLFLSKEHDNYYTALMFSTLALNTGYVFLVFRFGRRIFRKMFIDGRKAEWILYAAGALFSYVVITMLRIFPIDERLNLLLLFFLVYSFAILCFAIINTHEKTKQSFDAEFAREVISSGRDHYQKMDEMYDKLRTLRHDYKYHLIVINELLTDENKDALPQYLDNMKTQFEESEIHSFCDNSVINALLVCYAERCDKSKITFTTDIALPVNLSVPNFDLCIVLGNLLENAIEACQKQTDCKSIEIILKSLGQQLALRVKNSFDGFVNKSDERLKSTKKDGGFGLRSVEAVAARYDGELLLDWENGVFSAYVTMKL